MARTSRRRVAAGANNRAAGGAMYATLRVTLPGQAVVADREAGEATMPVAAAGAVRRWPWPRSYAVLLITMGSRPLSSMDRAPDFGSGGCEFESCSGYLYPEYLR